MEREEQQFEQTVSFASFFIFILFELKSWELVHGQRSRQKKQVVGSVLGQLEMLSLVHLLSISDGFLAKIGFGFVLLSPHVSVLCVLHLSGLCLSLFICQQR